jgi:hypothetical protein
MREIDFGGCSTDCETVGVEADFRLASILYQVWGQSKVYEAVVEGKIDHDEWAYCEPCDCASPFLFDEGAGCSMCLVCGSEFSEDNHQNTESENYPIKERKVEILLMPNCCTSDERDRFWDMMHRRFRGLG